MPKSKRNKQISLTQVKKGGVQKKEKLINEVKNALESYKHVFLFSAENMRNDKLKDLREEWKKTSRFFFGKNKVIQIALGRDASNEAQENIHKLSRRIHGQCGLILTNEEPKFVIDYFKNFKTNEFARAGFIATKDVILEAGPLTQFQHTMEPYLRQLGMPTNLKGGTPNLMSQYVVCQAGEVLKPEQATILKLLGIQMAQFHLTLEFQWSKDGKTKILKDRGVCADKPKKSNIKPRKKKNADEEMEGADDSVDDDDADQDDDDADQDDDDEWEDEDMSGNEEEQVKVTCGAKAAVRRLKKAK